MPPRNRKAEPTRAEEAISLEAAMNELTGIVSELESGQQPLDEALETFERGMRLLKDCDRQLEEAVGRIEIVRRLTESGAETESFDGTPTVDQTSEKSSETEPGNLF